MKVLVTGGAGFVGSNLIKRLLEDGNEVICLDNYSTGKKENELEGCKYFNFDLSESNVPFDEICAVQRFEKPDVIYHMAALARIQPSIKNPVKSIGNNFNSTLNILEWAREKNIPMLVQVLSIMVYGVVHMLGQNMLVNNCVSYMITFIIYQLLHVDFIMFTDLINLKMVLMLRC